MRLETHHSRLDAPALRLAGVCAFMFGSSARSLRQVLPPENIMSYRVSIGLLRRRPPPGQTRTFLPIKCKARPITTDGVCAGFCESNFGIFEIRMFGVLC